MFGNIPWNYRKIALLVRNEYVILQFYALDLGIKIFNWKLK